MRGLLLNGLSFGLGKVNFCLIVDVIDWNVCWWSLISCCCCWINCLRFLLDWWMFFLEGLVNYLGVLGFSIWCLVGIGNFFNGWVVVGVNVFFCLVMEDFCLMYRFLNDGVFIFVLLMLFFKIWVLRVVVFMLFFVFRSFCCWSKVLYFFCNFNFFFSCCNCNLVIVFLILVFFIFIFKWEFECWLFLVVEVLWWFIEFFGWILFFIKGIWILSWMLVIYWLICWKNLIFFFRWFLYFEVVFWIFCVLLRFFR